MNFSTLWKKVFHTVEKSLSREPPHEGEKGLDSAGASF